MADQEPQRFPFVAAAPLRVLRPPRAPAWRRALALLVFVGFAMVSSGLGDTVTLISTTVWMLAALVLWGTRAPSAPAPSRVRAGGEGLEIEGRLISRAQFLDAFLLRDPLRVHVRMRFGAAAVVHVGSVKEGRGLLRALGLDVSQTVAEFRTEAPSKWRDVGVGLGYLVLGSMVWELVGGLHTNYGLAGIAAGLVITGMAFNPLTTAKIRVGVEGIEIRWLRTQRFLLYEEIETVERFQRYPRLAPESAALRIVLSSGEEVRVPGYGRTLELLDARIREARKRSRRGDAGAVVALLRRGDRSVGAWASALRSLGAGANAGPRTAPVPRERLFRVVEDPSLPARDRAAAAVALGIDLDEEDRERLRTAAGATAMPKLRVAIETAASGAEEAEVEAALTEVDEGEGASARARV